MDKQQIKIYIGFITYGKATAKYLPYFLPSLKRQTYKDYKISAVDNSESENNENASYIKNNFPEINFKWAGKNLGYAKAFNLMIKEAAEAGAEYFLALNPDIVLEEDAAARLVEAMDNNGELGSATAKVLKWDFAKREKTNIIDSCGLKLLPGLRFVDFLEGKPSAAGCEGDIIGVSGAAAIYRLSALEKVKQGEEYFDELMFMYKEDCDLAYRLLLAGFKAKCVDAAVVYHDRSSGGQGEDNLTVVLNRKNKGRMVKKLSFLNQQIIFLKYWRLQNFPNKLAIIWFEFKMLIFILLVEPYLIKEFFKLRKIKSLIKVY